MCLVCPSMFCNKSVVKQMLSPRTPCSMCDGRFFASSPFCRLAGRGASFFCGILFVRPLQAAINLCRRQIPNDCQRHYRETNQTQCNSPYDTASCHFHTAIWLGRSQSILTQIERTSEPESMCYRASPLRSTSWLADPDFLGWPLIQVGVQAQADMAPLREEANDNIPGCALPVKKGIRVSTFRRKPSLCIVEYKRASWFHSLLSGLQGTEETLTQTADRQERHYLSPGNARKR